MKRSVPDYTEYEHQVMAYHRKTTSQKTWHWNCVPEQELYHSGFITDFNKHRLRKRLKKNGKLGEFGLDGLALDTTSNTYHGVQAKNYTVTITADKLGTFQSVVHNRLRVKNHQSKGYLYYTGKLQNDLKEDLQNGNAIIPVPFSPENSTETTQKEDETVMTLYKPQEEALNSLINGWTHIGFLSLPPGVGKTVVLGYYLKQCANKSIVIVSPTRVLANQNLKRLKAFLPTHDPLLSDADGDLDTEHVKKALLQTTLISTTFKSFANVFSHFDLSGTFIVVDESHHLHDTTVNSDNEQYKIQKAIDKSNKVLLLTGTPTEFMKDKYEEVYHYNLSNAIQDGHICDYKIYLPEICDSNTTLPIELKSINPPTDKVLQALFLVNGMLLHGCKRCIAYLSTIDECNSFTEAFEAVCDKYHAGTEVLMEKITCDTTQKKRDEILERFENDTSKDLYVTTSIHCVDEGVNLVKCDSIFMNTVPNDITFVQRLCRANRKDACNVNKIATCFLWKDHYEDTIDLFKYLSRCDPHSYTKKVEITRKDYDNTSSESMVNLEKLNYDFVQNISVRLVTTTQKWENKLEKVKEYMEKQKKRPSNHSKDVPTKKLGTWINNQLMNYQKRECIMKDESIRKKWKEFSEEYKMYFLSNEEEWENKLEEVKAYMEKEKKRPSKSSKDVPTKKLGDWLHNQQKNYKKRERIMKDESIRKKWEEFSEEYMWNRPRVYKD